MVKFTERAPQHRTEGMHVLPLSAGQAVSNNRVLRVCGVYHCTLSNGWRLKYLLQRRSEIDCANRETSLLRLRSLVTRVALPPQDGWIELSFF